MFCCGKKKKKSEEKPVRNPSTDFHRFSPLFTHFSSFLATLTIISQYFVIWILPFLGFQVPLPHAVGKEDASKEGGRPNDRMISKSKPESATHTESERSHHTGDGRHERKEPFGDGSVSDGSLTESEGEGNGDEGTADVMQVTLQLGPSKDTFQEVSRKAPERLIHLFASPKALQSSKEDVVKVIDFFQTPIHEPV
jgi:hypothetical protein